MKLTIPALAAVLVCGVAADAAAKETPFKAQFSMASGSRLGMQVQSMSDQLRAYFGAPADSGVLVGAVEPGSPADKAGIKAGDVIVEVDGAAVDEPGDVVRAIAGKKENDPAAIAVIRDKRRVSLTAHVRGPAGGKWLGGIDGTRRRFDLEDIGLPWFSPEGWQKLEHRLEAIEKRLEQLEKPAR
jgi:membrane-associated protease RseP (regulator of RpoE activity)